MKRSSKGDKTTTKKNRAEVISSRKSCSANGVGLSHYILVGQKEK